MAKRSDFAQKLLDDLRLRKERMTTSQRSGQSNQLPIDAYAYSKQTYRGSRDMKTNENIVSRAGNMHNRSTGSNRSASIEVSNHIVPYGRGQSSQQTADLSVALAFALENGGKLRRTNSSRTNSILGFLHQIGTGTMNFGKKERRTNLERQLPSTSNLPSLSHVQIKEISKGAQKLNQILRACSNGLNIDRYSIEIGKELLQGATDLEESLRMLVNLQEASEYMITPQKKNRITLLENDDDDDSDDDDNTVNIADQKLLVRPSFSFDKLSRHSQSLQEVGKAGVKQKLIALTYSTEGRNSNHEKQDVDTSKLVSHKRSTSYSHDVKSLAAFSEQKNHSDSSQSKPEKGRIPNVIAKLMGLDNLPDDVGSKCTTQNDSSSRQKTEGKAFKQTTNGSSKLTEVKTKQIEHFATQEKQKVIEASNILVNQNKELVSQAGKNFIIPSDSLEMVIHSAKPIQKDLDGIKAVKGPETGTTGIDKQANNAGRMSQKREIRKDIQVKGRKREKKNYREQKEKESNGSIPQIEKRYANKHVLSNQTKPQNHLEIQQPYMLWNSDLHEEKHHREDRAQQSAKKMLQVRPQRGKETIPKSLSKPVNDVIDQQKKQTYMNQATINVSSTEFVDVMKSERFLNGHFDDPIKEGATDLNVSVKQMSNRSSDQIFSPRGIMEKHVHVLATKKAKDTKIQKIDVPRKIDEKVTEKNKIAVTEKNKIAHQLTSPTKHQNFILQEEKQRRHDKLSVSKGAEQDRTSRFKEAEKHIIGCNKSAAIVKPPNVTQQPQKEADHPPLLYSPAGDEFQSLAKSVTPVSNDSSQKKKLMATNDKQDQATHFDAHEELKSSKTVADTMKGSHEDNTTILYRSYRSQQEDHQNITKIEIQEPLTASENSLKWTLLASQPFLNTAEALFKLNIPFTILQGSDYDRRDEGSKLVLECGYEVMRRKGIRQELAIHPSLKISVSATKIRSLDDLVKRLHKDMEKMKFYGRNGSSNIDAEDYLPKMLESDVSNKDPDMNCMWDLGWNDNMFAFLEKFDVIRDVEKQLLNGLLDEITGDLLHI
ncbi:muscle M-line assembly protein unc-89-like [Quillaja saponaria]|uniref:Muscle M-line assembly protein unc-89-like n=1 Tax=Quillaja saponaria TaxID=32244 RepID=A0AAD7LIM8_QUISA|nr:muscle M-line assembly protein unc-89-like [Quillaja saponaria]